MLLSVRELLVRQRTQLVNAMRGHAAEMGVVAPLGEKGVAERRTEIAAADDAGVPPAAKEAIALLGREAERVEMRRRAIDTTLMQQQKANPVSRRLAAIPGIGPVAALSFTLRVDPRSSIGAPLRGLARSGATRMFDRRQTAAGRHQPGRRRAAAAAAGARRDRGYPTRQTRPASRLAVAAYLLGRKPRKLAAVALANKMARIVWAMMTSGEATGRRRPPPSRSSAAGAGLEGKDADRSVRRSTQPV